MAAIGLAPIAVAVGLFVDARDKPSVAATSPAPPPPPPRSTLATAEAPALAPTAAREDASEPTAPAEPATRPPEVVAGAPDAPPSPPPAPPAERAQAAPTPARPPVEAGAEPPSPASPAGAAPPSAVPSPTVRGELRVQARPWAQIEVDGKAMGNTPRVLQLAPGPHVVKLTSTGRAHTERVTISADKATMVYHDFGR